MKKSKLLLVGSLALALIGSMLSGKASELEMKEEVNKAVDEKMAASKKEEEKEEGS